MKKLLYLLLVLVLLVGACQPPKESTDGGMQVYENKDFSFKISYPTSWTKQETGDTQPIVNFLAPEKDGEALDGFSVGVADVPEGTKMDDFKDAVIQDFKTKLPDLQVDVKPTTVGGVSAYRLEYSVSGGQFVQVFVIKDNKTYIITALTDVARLEEVKPLFDSVFNSFEFI